MMICVTSIYILKNFPISTSFTCVFDIKLSTTYIAQGRFYLSSSDAMETL